MQKKKKKINGLQPQRNTAAAAENKLKKENIKVKEILKAAGHEGPPPKKPIEWVPILDALAKTAGTVLNLAKIYEFYKHIDK